MVFILPRIALSWSQRVCEISPHFAYNSEEALDGFYSLIVGEGILSERQACELSQTSTSNKL